MKTNIWEYETIDRLMSIIEKQNIVLVGGCFELLHFGHTHFLVEAKKQGDVLVVLLESDEYINRSKNRKAIHNQSERAFILSELRVVDYVLKIPLFKSDMEYFELVKKINPKIIAVTKGDPRYIEKKQQAEQVGGEVVTVCELIKPFSTSNILKT